MQISVSQGSENYLQVSHRCYVIDFESSVGFSPRQQEQGWEASLRDSPPVFWLELVC